MVTHVQSHLTFHIVQSKLVTHVQSHLTFHILQSKLVTHVQSPLTFHILQSKLVTHVQSPPTFQIPQSKLVPHVRTPVMFLLLPPLAEYYRKSNLTFTSVIITTITSMTAATDTIIFKQPSYLQVSLRLLL